MQVAAKAADRVAGRQRQTQGDLGTQSHGTRATESAGLPKPSEDLPVKPIPGFPSDRLALILVAMRVALVVVIIALTGVASAHA